jgi:exodeoxyribonuclease V alpha subunit
MAAQGDRQQRNSLRLDGRQDCEWPNRTKRRLAIVVAKSQPTDARDREPLSGIVERVTFHSSETGFCVLRVKVRGHRDLVTVLGSAADIHTGEYVQASGRWERHREHGMQFRALFLQVTAPTSLEGIERYLAPE